MPVQGTIIEGTAYLAHTNIISRQVSIGSIYKISGFRFQTPHRAYRASLFDHILALAPTMLSTSLLLHLQNFLQLRLRLSYSRTSFSAPTLARS
ncbi:hypothetical protein LINGRAHAP2_LOCUS14413 [Linum grandiflorum]